MEHICQDVVTAIAAVVCAVIFADLICGVSQGLTWLAGALP